MGKQFRRREPPCPTFLRVMTYKIYVLFIWDWSMLGQFLRVLTVFIVSIVICLWNDLTRMSYIILFPLFKEGLRENFRTILTLPSIQKSIKPISQHSCIQQVENMVMKRSTACKMYCRISIDLHIYVSLCMCIAHLCIIVFGPWGVAALPVLLWLHTLLTYSRALLQPTKCERHCYTCPWLLRSAIAWNSHSFCSSFCCCFHKMGFTTAFVVFILISLP